MTAAAVSEWSARLVRSLLPAAVGLVLVTAPASSQRTATFEPEVAREARFPLTIRSIMRGPELVGRSPEEIRWSDDSRWIYFRWLPGGEPWHEERSLFRVSASGGKPERLDGERADSLEPLFAAGDLSPDHRRRISEVGGDLYLVDRDSREVTRLTRTRPEETNPRFSDDGERIFFRRTDDLYALDLEDRGIRQLTDIREGPPPEEEEATALERHLEEQQRQLFEHVRVEEDREEEDEAREERREADWPDSLHRHQDEEVVALAPAPTGRRAVAVLAAQPDIRGTLVPEWITVSGFTETVDARPKVGAVETVFRVLDIDLTTGEPRDLTDDLVRDAGAVESDGEAEGGEEEDPPRPVLATLRFVGWNDAGTHALLFALDADHREWRLHALDAESGELEIVTSHRDTAWVDGPCFQFCVGWIPESNRIYYVSEDSGWAHLYTVRPDGTGRRRLTRGEWEVRSVTIPESGDHFLLETTEESPFDVHVYRAAFDGSDRTRITDGSGHFEATPSPDGRRLAVVHSREDRPPELHVMAADPGAPMERITRSPVEPWLDFPWITPEIIHFEARDGARVPAHIYRPSDLGAEPNGAAILFVHGAGYLQNVHHGWSSPYYREYMFNNFLAARGYTILDIDYRGSAGYGSAWRTAVHGHMGSIDLSDQVDGVGYLVEEEGVDPDRVGIYGGSYGGFLTLMALFTTEDTFRAGAALRSVADWTHYNHPYTSRILDLPPEQPEAYRRSSPIYFAEGLDPDERLLIAHGMADANVHFSDVARLTQRLIELGKEGWELATYPASGHSFEAPSAWTDEYRRIFELFEETIGSGSSP